MLNNWNSIYALNLTSSNDPHFKLVQILELDRRSLFIDIRETFKGRKTKVGIMLLLPEFQWLKKILITNDSKLYTLEHGNRIIKVDKYLNLITIIKSDGIINEILLSPIEISTLKNNLNIIGDKIASIATELSLSLDYAIDTYVNESYQ